MGVSMGVARNADRLTELNFDVNTRFAQVLSAYNPTASDDTVTFLFVQKKITGPPDYLEITCSASVPSGTMSGRVTSHQQGGRLFKVNASAQTACALASMPTADAVTWSGSFSLYADAKLSKTQLGFKKDENMDGTLSNIHFGW